MAGKKQEDVIEREVLEKTCQSLIVNFVNMKLEGFPNLTGSEMHVLSSSSNTKGLSDKRSKKSNHLARAQQLNRQQYNVATESSVDGPASTPTPSLSVPSDLSTLVEQVNLSSDVGSMVPQTLPMEMRSNLSSVRQKDVEKLFNVTEGVERVREGRLTQVELIVLHMRSYRNILVYDLSDFKELQTRFLNFFSSIFADVVELCYPASEARQSLEGQLLQDFQSHTGKGNSTN